MRTAALIIVCIFACACTSEDSDITPASARPVDAGPASEGQLAYETFCASCHDSGSGGAPVIGVADQWDERSPLWQAVLFEHANEGYLDMPARGGMQELSEQTVAAAAEYILETTFQDRPPD